MNRNVTVKLNEIVRVVNSELREIYGKVGEVVGYADDLFGGIGYAVKFDDKVWVLGEKYLESTGKFGSQQTIQYSAFHPGGGIVVVRNEIPDNFIPRLVWQDEVLIIEMPTIYELKHIMPVIRSGIFEHTNFEKIKHIIMDSRRLRQIGYLGCGSELIEFGQRFIKKGGKSFCFVGLDSEIYDVFKMLCPEKVTMPENLNSIEDAYLWIAQNIRMNITKWSPLNKIIEIINKIFQRHRKNTIN